MLFFVLVKECNIEIESKYCAPVDQTDRIHHYAIIKVISYIKDVKGLSWMLHSVSFCTFLRWILMTIDFMSN